MSKLFDHNSRFSEHFLNVSITSLSFEAWMNREIVQIQIGECGNRVGTAFWSRLAAEHDVRPNGQWEGSSDLQLEGMPVYYHETGSGKFRPRAILIDSEPTAINTVRGSDSGGLFLPENCICSESGVNNNVAHGPTDCCDLVEPVAEAVRKAVELCDAFQGFQFLHSLGGNTGSRFGGSLLEQLTDEYPTHIISTYSVFPSPKVSDNVLEPYNCVLSLPYLIESASEVFSIDNGALYDIYSRNEELPTYGMLNYLLSMVMSGTTCSLRFPGQLNEDLHRRVINLVPFPRLHFLVCGFGPTHIRRDYRPRYLTVPELVFRMCDPENMMVSCDPREGVYLGAFAQFQGRMGSGEVPNSIRCRHAVSSCRHVNWIPRIMKTSRCDLGPTPLRTSATLISNTTAFRQLLARIDQAFARMYSQRKLLYLYDNEGIERDEFDMARAQLTDLIDEYETCDSTGLGERPIQQTEGS
jgi:tubulin beta